VVTARDAVLSEEEDPAMPKKQARNEGQHSGQASSKQKSSHDNWPYNETAS
jgi:hypothetical protein